MKAQVDMVEGLTYRIVEDLKANGVNKPWMHDFIFAHVKSALEEIQHRLYQNVIANADDLARDIWPRGERRG
jgi:hypothetical protein